MLKKSIFPKVVTSSKKGLATVKCAFATVKCAFWFFELLKQALEKSITYAVILNGLKSVNRYTIPLKRVLLYIYILSTIVRRPFLGRLLTVKNRLLFFGF